MRLKGHNSVAIVSKLWSPKILPLVNYKYLRIKFLKILFKIHTKSEGSLSATATFFSNFAAFFQICGVFSNFAAFFSNFGGFFSKMSGIFVLELEKKPQIGKKAANSKQKGISQECILTCGRNGKNIGTLWNEMALKMLEWN